MSKLTATVEIGHVSDAKLLEQYALMLRETRALASAVPLHRLLSVCEAEIVVRGREVNRTSLEQLVQERLEDAEKKGSYDAARVVVSGSVVGRGSGRS